MNITACIDAKLKVKKWGYFLGSPKRGPFLHVFARADKMTVSAISVGGGRSKRSSNILAFLHAKEKAPDTIFWLVVDRWFLCAIFNIYC